MRSSQKFTLRLTIVSLSLPTGVQRIDRTGLDKTRYQLYSEARLMSSEVSKVLFKWTTVVFRSFSNNTKNENFWRGTFYTFYIVRSLSGSLVFFGLHLFLCGMILGYDKQTVLQSFSKTSYFNVCRKTHC